MNPWATQEYQVMGGQQFLPSEPNLKNSAYPTTRSGFLKGDVFCQGKANTDYTAFMKHWLEIHVPNVKETMLQVDGFRYVVSHSLEPRTENYAGMAELYFQKPRGVGRIRRVIKGRWYGRMGRCSEITDSAQRDGNGRNSIGKDRLYVIGG
ncbi:MAG: hypothetical protein CM1200mP24_05080 [Gammaproteobacteria bacterium]|nr:MAG: hypothetical protein CM1200mP24_05080 [Gammaproteobacteria bacterium]